MAKKYNKVNLRDVEDSAAKYGYDTHEARFPNDKLEMEKLGLSLQKINPNKKHPVAHKHKTQEEVIVVLSGSGQMKIDDKVVELKAMDTVRIHPGTARAMEAGKDGLEFMVFGAPKSAQKDWEMVDNL